MQATRPRAIVDLIHSAENFRIELGSEGNLPQPRKCERCGYICSQAVCKACQLLEGLNKGLPSMGISRPGQVKSRTATKLAAEKLRALSVSADRTAAGRDSECGKVGCQCAGADSAAAARMSCSEAEQSTASDPQRGTAEMGSHAYRDADGAHVPAVVGTNGHDHGASDKCSPIDMQLPQQSVSAGQSSCGGACECGVPSIPGGACAPSSDWPLASNFAEDDSKLMQAHNRHICDPGSSTVNMDGPVLSQQPLRVHGKLYESNLRQVDAHPSARRPVRADFGSTW